MWQKIVVGVGVATVMAVVGAVASSDWPPWSSVHRAEAASLIGIATNINLDWKDYCMAEGNGNKMAQVAISRDLQDWESEYENLTKGRSLPLRPCP